MLGGWEAEEVGPSVASPLGHWSITKKGSALPSLSLVHHGSPRSMASTIPFEDGRIDDNSYYNLKALHLLCTSGGPQEQVVPIVPLRDPSLPAAPLQVAYTAEFRHVIGLYNGFHQLAAAEHAACTAAGGQKHVQLLPKRYLGPSNLPAPFVRCLAAPPVGGPRLLVCLAFTLKQCSAHYTAWKRRRDIALDPVAFASCCHDLFADAAAFHAMGHWIDPVGLPDAYLDSKNALRQPAGVGLFGDDCQRAIAAWCPSRSHLLPEVSGNDPPEDFPHQDSLIGGSPAVRRVYDPWLAVAWELRTMRFASPLSPKNFQTWNHRKELMVCAASRTTGRWREWAMATNDVAAVRAAVEQWWGHHRKGGGAAVSYLGTFDELRLCDSTLTYQDSKNYHVWSHRGWFVWFAGLLATAPGVARELEFTRHLIMDTDVFNNSAWCHRLYVVEAELSILMEQRKGEEEGRRVAQWLAEALLCEPAVWNEKYSDGRLRLFHPCFPAPVAFDQGAVSKAVQSDIECDASMLASVGALFEREASFAVSAAVAESRNECPFTYFGGLLSMWIARGTAAIAASGAAPRSQPALLHFYGTILDRLLLSLAALSNGQQPLHAAPASARRLRPLPPITGTEAAADPERFLKRVFFGDVDDDGQLDVRDDEEAASAMVTESLAITHPQMHEASLRYRVVTSALDQLADGKDGPWANVVVEKMCAVLPVDDGTIECRGALLKAARDTCEFLAAVDPIRAGFWKSEGAALT